MNREPAVDALTLVEQIHRDVDHSARRLAEAHSGRLQCRRGCRACCVDEITVFEVEAALIRAHHAGLLAQGTPHPEGACAFLDAEGACRVYEHRPYVCRTQGYPLRWIDDDRAGGPVELRDICPLNEEGPPLEALPEQDCWTLGPVEEKLARRQLASGAGTMGRVRLRDLFAARD